MVRPEDYDQIPPNRHGIKGGSILLPTTKAITAHGGTSLQFVEEQGGDADTFIFVFGVRTGRRGDGSPIDFVEGVFLSKRGQGFRPTWGVGQLLAEVDSGGWRVIPTEQVLESWCARVEERMNRRA